MKEDFVTYGLAVKLRKKGFNIDTDFCYNQDGGIVRVGTCPAPQTHEVLKWLRETKNIEVVASFSYRNKVWGYQVGDMTLFEDSILSYDYSFPSYEQAALAGIEYVIDNLI